MRLEGSGKEEREEGDEGGDDKKKAERRKFDYCDGLKIEKSGKEDVEEKRTLEKLEKERKEDN